MKSCRPVLRALCVILVMQLALAAVLVTAVPETSHAINADMTGTGAEWDEYFAVVAEGDFATSYAIVEGVRLLDFGSAEDRRAQGNNWTPDTAGGAFGAGHVDQAPALPSKRLVVDTASVPQNMVYTVQQKKLNQRVSASAATGGRGVVGGEDMVTTTANVSMVDHEALFTHLIGASRVVVDRLTRLMERLRAATQRTGEHIDRAYDSLDQQYGDTWRSSRSYQTDRDALELGNEALRVRLERTRMSGERLRNTSAVKSKWRLATAAYDHEQQLARLVDLSHRRKSSALADQELLNQLRLEELQERHTSTLSQLRQHHTAKLAGLGKTLEEEQEAALAALEADLSNERHDLHLEITLLRNASSLRTSAIVDAVHVGAERVQEGLRVLVQRPVYLAKLLAVVFGLQLAYFVCKDGSRLLAQQAYRIVAMPPLVRDTSRQWSVTDSIWLMGGTGKRRHRRPKKLDPQGEKQPRAVPEGNTRGAKGGVWDRTNAGEEGLGTGPSTVPRAFCDIALDPAIEHRVEALIEHTVAALSRKAPLRHTLIAGPPGTGKSLLAKRIAVECDMDYAMISGGDFGPLGSDAALEVRRLFSWARSSPRGMVLVIDDAEAILADRSRLPGSPRRRSRDAGAAAVAASAAVAQQAYANATSVLNALLYETGRASAAFMLVIATSQARTLDAAVLDRMDNVLELPMPHLRERHCMLRLATDELLLQFVDPIAIGDVSLMRRVSHTCRRSASTLLAILSGSGSRPQIKLHPGYNLQDELQWLAHASEGLSGRECYGLVRAVQTAVFTSVSCELTSDVWRAAVEQKLEDLRRKQAIRQEAFWNVS